MAVPLCLAGPTGTWTLPAGTWQIGRGEQCRILVNDPRLSRTHAQVVVSVDGDPRIEDLGSHNGVLVNGDRIRGATALRDGDVVVCGPLVLVVSIAGTPGPIPEPEPPRPPVYQRRPTEEMTPGDFAALATPSVRPQRPSGSASRPIDPSIAAAVAGHSGERPSTAPAHATSALTGQHGSAPDAPPPPPRPAEASTRRRTDGLLPDDAPHSGEDSSALEPGLGITDPPPPPSAWQRLAAGTADGCTAVVAAAILALPALVAGWAAGVIQAGATLAADQLPVLGPGAAVPLRDLLNSLLRPGGLQRAWVLSDALRQLDDRVPFLLVFLGATGAVLLAVLVLMLGLVSATVIHGGPSWHQRLRLRVVQARNGHHPGWVRATVRWALAAVLWPLAVPAALLGKRAPHDLLAGCMVRRRR